MPVNIDHLLQAYTASVDRSHAHASRDVQQSNAYEQTAVDRRAEFDKKIAEFLADLLRDGHQKLADVLDPAFLEVNEKREAFAYAVRAFEILHTEVLHESCGTAALLHGGESQRQDYSREPKPRQILTHIGWANIHEYVREREHSSMSGALGMTQRTYTYRLKERHLHPTEAGVATVDRFRDQAGLPSRDALDEQYQQSRKAASSVLREMLG